MPSSLLFWKKESLFLNWQREDVPCSEKRIFFERTLRRWIASYKKDGFDGLTRRERNDKGVSKTITPEALVLAEQMRRELPRRSAGLLCELLEREGFKVARSTLERHLRMKGLSGKQLTQEANGTPQTRRFVRVGRNTLWQSDIKYGPCLPDPKSPKKKFRTYLLVIIDDATRLVVHASFYSDHKQTTNERFCELCRSLSSLIKNSLS